MTKEKKENKRPIKVFVDTSAWLAFFAEFDANHQKARLFLQKQKPILVTSDFVFAELIATSKRLIDFRGLVRIGESVLSLTEEFLPISEIIRRLAWQKFKSSSSRKISFIDWANLVLMEKYSLEKIFAFDEHFARMGLEIVP